MNKTKIWLIVAASLVLIGVIIFGGVMAMYNWDFTKLSTVEYETNNYEINEKFNNISINTNTDDVIFAPSDEGICKVVCYEEQNAKHLVVVKDGTLIINKADKKKWYEYIGINFGAPKITVYIPQGEYGALLVNSSTSYVEIPENFKFEGIDISISTGNVKCLASALGKIKIKTSTGDICVQNATADTLDLSVSTGKVIVQSVACGDDIKINVSTGRAKLTDVTCKNITSNGSTGDISLNNVIATEKFSIERSTGDVRFENSDAAEIFVKTDTGDVKGSLLTNKVFITQTDTGSVDVPKTITGGRCEITTDTGDIAISLQ